VKTKARFQLHMQHKAFGEREQEAGCAVLKIPFEMPCAAPALHLLQCQKIHFEIENAYSSYALAMHKRFRL